jgi:hypothetical protein
MFIILTLFTLQTDNQRGLDRLTAIYGLKKKKETFIFVRSSVFFFNHHELCCNLSNDYSLYIL